MAELQDVTYVNHDANYFNNTVHSKLRRVALNSSGDVVGIHNKDNTNLWEDGTSVDWTIYESIGWNCMVQIPKFYYKVEFGSVGALTDVYRCEVSEKPIKGYKLHPAFERETGIIENYQYMSAFEGWLDSSGRLRSLPSKTVSGSKTRAQFRVAAQLNGENFRQQEFYLTSAIQMLFITEYKSLNSQMSLGLGRSVSGHLQTGQSLQYGNNSFGDKVNNTKCMSYRGIENFYGNYWKFLDGLNIQNNVPYVSKLNFADDVFTGNYNRVGTFTMPTNNGFIKNFNKLNNEYDFTFFPSSIGGSPNTYFGDQYYQSPGNRIAFFGGHSYSGVDCGAFCLNLNSAASYAFALIGARLTYLAS